jgi:GT2 family glycosyltransferase
MEEKSSCDIIVPTYNGSAHLPRLLSSIKRQTLQDYACYVIDDNSQDDTVEIVRRDFPWVHLIEQQENMGPSHNRNVAIRKGAKPYVVIFDDDTYLDDDNWLKNALEHMENNQEVGQLATMIVNGFEPDILLDCGIVKNWYLFGGLFHNTPQDEVAGRHRKGRVVLGACSAGTVLRRELFERVGGFDPRYYYPTEDLDLSLRFHLAGFKVWYEPSLKVFHYESQAMGKSLSRKMYLYRRNCLLTLADNYPLTHVLYMLAAVLGREIVKPVLLYAFQKLRGKPRDVLPDSVRDYKNALLFLVKNCPGIIRKRMASRQYRSHSRHHLSHINSELLKDVSS